MRLGRSLAQHSSHCQMLIKTMDFTKTVQPNKDVLELGSGFFSTAVLHWLCFEQGRNLVSYDNNPEYMKLMSKFNSSWHKVNLIDDWNSIQIEKPWGLAFVDHAPAERRYYDVIRLANYAFCVVVHDTDPQYENAYFYSKAFNKFKYRYDYTKCSPNTTVLSNFIDLEILGD